MRMSQAEAETQELQGCSFCVATVRYCQVTYLMTPVTNKNNMLDWKQTSGQHSQKF